MKKLILKTAFITLGVTIIALVAVFGLMSLWAPAIMMDLTASLGMSRISGDYAYQEYERSGDLSYLAQSFTLAAGVQDDANADARFEILYAHEEFEEFCIKQGEITLTEQTKLTYRNYIFGQEACVKYRLANSEEEQLAACEFAIETTPPNLPAGNPIVTLAVEAATNRDKEFCGMFLEKIDEKYNVTSNPDNLGDLIYIYQILIEVAI